MLKARATDVQSGRGLRNIVVATVVAGIAGYVVTWLVFRAVGAADYAVFAIFWSATYLVVGALSGIQQEITRATLPRTSGGAEPRPIARNFALIAALVVAGVVLALIPLWMSVVFPEDGVQLAFPLAVATGTYAVVAVLAGTLYGLSLWTPTAWLVAIDGVLRLALIALALILHTGSIGLAWAVALPFVLSGIIVWLRFRRRVVGRSRIDVSPRRLVWNVSRTVAAAASTAVLVSGFPVILRLTSHDVAAAALGVVVLAITLVRAPLIVTAMSLQSFLIVQLRPEAGFAARLIRLVALVVVVGGVVAVIGAVFGPALFLIIFGPEATVSGGFIAALTSSSALVAVMFVTGPALLSRGRHRDYTVAWLAAAAATLIALALPLPFFDRTLLSLAAGPAVGLAIQLIGLARLRRSTREVSHA